MDSHQTDTATQSTSWLDRFLSAGQPGLVIVGLGVVASAVTLGTIELSKPGREALQVVDRTLAWSIWSRATVLVALWLFSTVITHILALFMGLRAPFPKALQTMGRAWILYTVILIVVDFVLIAFVSVGWTVLAEFWYISGGRAGGLLWIFFYPAAIRIAYGSQARSCLMTFLTLVIVLLLAGLSALLILVVFR
jgi:hypothetical protein